MSYDDIGTDDFRKAFWEWFDSIPAQERLKFKNYPSDMADLFFYNKFWKQRTNASVSPLATNQEKGNWK
jgi:hypothetical protein